MKTFWVSFLGIFITTAFTLTCSEKSLAQAQKIRAMTYNIRYDNPDDAPNNWDNRKARVANPIAFYEPTFLGTQEALFHQLGYLDQQLPNYKWIGKGRTNGEKDGEFWALFYDSRKVKLVAQTDSTIWLSQTPSVPSKSWDAALPRILTWGKFRFKKDGEEIYIFNTYFDHVGDTARTKSAKLILNNDR